MNETVNLIKNFDKKIEYLNINYNHKSKLLTTSKGNDLLKLKAVNKSFSDKYKGYKEFKVVIDKAIQTGFMKLNANHTKNEADENPIIFQTGLDGVCNECIDANSDLSKLITARFITKEKTIKILLIEPFNTSITTVLELKDEAFQPLQILANSSFKIIYFKKGNAFYQLDLVKSQLTLISKKNTRENITTNLSSDAQKSKFLLFDDNCVIILENEKEIFRFNLKSYIKETNQFQLSPDGKNILFNEIDKGKTILNIVNIESNQTKKTAFDQAIYFHPSVTKNQIWFSYASETNGPSSFLTKYDILKNKKVKELSDEFVFTKEQKAYFDFSFDKTEKIILKGDFASSIIGLDVGKNEPVFFENLPYMDRFNKLIFSNDNSMILVTTYSGKILIYKIL